MKITDKELLAICNLSNLRVEFANLIGRIERDPVTNKEIVTNHTIYSLLDKEVNSISEGKVETRVFRDLLQMEEDVLIVPEHKSIEEIKRKAGIVYEYYEQEKLEKSDKDFLDNWQIVYAADGYKLITDFIEGEFFIPPKNMEILILERVVKVKENEMIDFLEEGTREKIELLDTQIEKLENIFETETPAKCLYFISWDKEKIKKDKTSIKMSKILVDPVFKKQYELVINKEDEIWLNKECETYKKEKYPSRKAVKNGVKSAEEREIAASAIRFIADWAPLAIELLRPAGIVGSKILGLASGTKLENLVKLLPGEIVKLMDMTAGILSGDIKNIHKLFATIVLVFGDLSAISYETVAKAIESTEDEKIESSAEEIPPTNFKLNEIYFGISIFKNKNDQYVVCFRDVYQNSQLARRIDSGNITYDMMVMKLIDNYVLKKYVSQKDKVIVTGFNIGAELATMLGLIGNYKVRNFKNKNYSVSEALLEFNMFDLAGIYSTTYYNFAKSFKNFLEETSLVVAKIIAIGKLSDGGTSAGLTTIILGYLFFIDSWKKEKIKRNIDIFYKWLCYLNILECPNKSECIENNFSNCKYIEKIREEGGMEYKAISSEASEKEVEAWLEHQKKLKELKKVLTPKLAKIENIKEFMETNVEVVLNLNGILVKKILTKQEIISLIAETLNIKKELKDSLSIFEYLSLIELKKEKDYYVIRKEINSQIIQEKEASKEEQEFQGKKSTSIVKDIITYSILEDKNNITKIKNIKEIKISKVETISVYGGQAQYDGNDRYINIQEEIKGLSQIITDSPFGELFSFMLKINQDIQNNFEEYIRKDMFSSVILEVKDNQDGEIVYKKTPAYQYNGISFEEYTEFSFFPFINSDKKIEGISLNYIISSFRSLLEDRVKRMYLYGFEPKLYSYEEAKIYDGYTGTENEYNTSDCILESGKKLCYDDLSVNTLVKFVYDNSDKEEEILRKERSGYFLYPKIMNILKKNPNLLNNYISIVEDKSDILNKFLNVKYLSFGHMENEKYTERGLKYLYNYPNKVSVRDDITTHHQLDWIRRGLVRIRITKSPEKTSKKIESASKKMVLESDQIYCSKAGLFSEFEASSEKWATNTGLTIGLETDNNNSNIKKFKKCGSGKCSPEICGSSWTNLSDLVVINGKKVLTNKSTITCIKDGKVEGVISFGKPKTNITIK